MKITEWRKLPMELQELFREDRKRTQRRRRDNAYRARLVKSAMILHCNGAKILQESTFVGERPVVMEVQHEECSSGIPKTRTEAKKALSPATWEFLAAIRKRGQKPRVL